MEDNHAHRAPASMAEEAWDSDSRDFKDIPDDVLAESILLRLPLNKIPCIAAACKKSAKLVASNRFWERLAYREMGDVCVTISRPGRWRDIFHDLKSLTFMRWSRIPRPSHLDGDWPPPRWGHTLVPFGFDSMLVYGGECSGPASDVYVLKNNGVWQKIQCSGKYPRERFGHSCVVYSGNAIIFGGSNGEEYFDDLTCLEVEHWSWWKPETTGHPPTARSSHSMTLLGNKAYVFGGIGVHGAMTNRCLHDVVVLDLSSWTWSHPQVTGDVPQKRFVHRMVTIGDQLLLFGGRTNVADKFNDLHWFDTKALSWKKEEDVQGDLPRTRGGCTFVSIGRKVITFCGRAENDVCLFDGVFVLDTERTPLRWDHVYVPGDKHQPTPRGAHSFGYLDGKVVLFGGYGPSRCADESEDREDEKPLDDLIYLDLVRTSPEDTMHMDC